MNIKKLLINTMAVTILSACGSFASTYVKPDVTAPQNWSNNAVLTNKPQPGISLATLQWWQEFNDDELNQLLAAAIANNNDINQAVVNIKSAQLALSQIQAQWVPSLGLSVGDVIGNLPILYTNSNTVFGGISASYTVNILKIIRERQLAEINVSLQQAVLNGVRLTIISQTVTTYFNLLAAREQLLLGQQSSSDLKAHLQYLNIKKDLGAASKLEVEEIHRQLVELDAKLPAIQTNITLLENTLQILMNHNPGKIDNKVAFEQVKTNINLPHQVSSAVLEQRPDIMIAEDNLKIAAAKEGIAYSDLFPQFSILLPFGVLGNQSLATSGTQMYSSYWLTLASATFPLLNLSTYTNIKHSKNLYKSSQYAYIEAVRVAFSDVDNGLAWQKNSAKTLSLAKQELNIAENLYELSYRRYISGHISYADTINHKLQLDNAEDLYNRAKLAQINSMINLYQVLGGGYLAHDIAVANASKEH